jgi:hypothetical protein
MPGLALAQGAHDLEALDRGVGCRHRFETTHGLDQQFELAMVGLEHVVQVFYLPVFGFQGELPFSFQLGDCDAVAGGLVGVEFRWLLPALQPAKGLSQKALRGFGAAGRREEEVDRVAPFVDRPVQVGPFAPNLDVGLIQTPARIKASPPEPAQPLLHLRRIALHPAIDGRVIDIDATFRQHFLEIAVADAVPAVPADRP